MTTMTRDRYVLAGDADIRKQLRDSSYHIVRLLPEQARVAAA